MSNPVAYDRACRIAIAAGKPQPKFEGAASDATVVWNTERVWFHMQRNATALQRAIRGRDSGDASMAAAGIDEYVRAAVALDTAKSSGVAE